MKNTIEEMKTQNIPNFKAVYEMVYCLLSFSFSLMFGNKLLKLLWISLIIATSIFIHSFWYAILFAIMLAISMEFVLILFIIVFGFMLSRERD